MVTQKYQLGDVVHFSASAKIERVSLVESKGIELVEYQVKLPNNKITFIYEDMIIEKVE